MSKEVVFINNLGEELLSKSDAILYYYFNILVDNGSVTKMIMDDFYGPIESVNDDLCMAYGSGFDKSYQSELYLTKSAAYLALEIYSKEGNYV